MQLTKRRKYIGKGYGIFISYPFRPWWMPRLTFHYTVTLDFLKDYPMDIQQQIQVDIDKIHCTGLAIKKLQIKVGQSHDCFVKNSVAFVCRAIPVKIPRIAKPFSKCKIPLIPRELYERFL